MSNDNTRTSTPRPPRAWCAGSQIPSRLRCAFSPLAALRLLPWGLPLLVGRALPATKMRYRKDKAICDPAHSAKTKLFATQHTSARSPGTAGLLRLPRAVHWTHLAPQRAAGRYALPALPGVAQHRHGDCPAPTLAEPHLRRRRRPPSKPTQWALLTPQSASPDCGRDAAGRSDVAEVAVPLRPTNLIPNSVPRTTSLHVAPSPAHTDPARATFSSRHIATRVAERRAGAPGARDELACLASLREAVGVRHRARSAGADVRGHPRAECGRGPLPPREPVAQLVWTGAQRPRTG